MLGFDLNQVSKGGPIASCVILPCAWKRLLPPSMAKVRVKMLLFHFYNATNPYKIDYSENEINGTTRITKYNNDIINAHTILTQMPQMCNVEIRDKPMVDDCCMPISSRRWYDIGLVFKFYLGQWLVASSVPSHYHKQCHFSTSRANLELEVNL